MTKSALEGTWRLLEMVTRFDDGTTSLPYGPNCDGRLLYGRDGQMAAHLWDPDRHTSEPTNSASSDPVYFAYTGRWSLDGETMTHVVVQATNPDWAGESITRDVAWDGSDLLLTARVVFGGKSGTAQLRWRKLSDEESLR